MGDLLTSALSIYIIARAATLGVSSAGLIRMAMNVILENIFDLIPLFGNFFDFYWKANLKNLQIIQAYRLEPSRSTIKSRVIVALFVIAIVSLILASAYFSYQALAFLIHWLLSLKNP